ncbi:hypothetical protein HMI54_002058 [Coelomomyces lativittatus]|nr:hypothetical protein HMI55_005746 [Coelomomyces lativittatus]KAJ1514934.1 hypothetical protein HMI56_007069 [Coelomomyces lativittatus]KAJ1518207.1 hypothetical protein HMI54_002058 [Coelomomyces lativittatus]
MKFGHILATETSDLPEQYHPQILAYKKLKKLVKAIVLDMETQGIHPDQFPKGGVPSTLMSTRIDDTSTITSLQKSPHLPLNINQTLGTSKISYVLSSPKSQPTSMSNELCGPTFSEEIPQFNSHLIIQPVKESLSTAKELSQPLSDSLVVIPLSSDTRFFSYLSTALTKISEFQNNCVATFLNVRLPYLVDLLQFITRRGASDRFVWKRLLQMYLHESIFGDTQQCTLQPYAKSTKLLAEFEAHVNEVMGIEMSSLINHTWSGSVRRKNHRYRCGIGKSSEFRTPKDREETNLEHIKNPGQYFLMLLYQWNHAILDLHKYIELTSTAVTKILKKHDKKTKLPSLSLFSSSHATSSIADIPWKNMLMLIHLRFLNEWIPLLESITPLIHRHLCPICFELVYPPLKLKCGHVFCCSCIYLSSLHTFFPNQRPPFPLHLLFLGQLPWMEWSCALCRAPSGITSTQFLKNFDEFADISLEQYLQLHFKEEMKRKKKQWKERILHQDRVWVNWILFQRLR